MRKDVCIISENGAFSGSAILQKALDCAIVYDHKDYKGFSDMSQDAIYDIENIPLANTYIFAGCLMLTKVDLSMLKGDIKLIISDSHYFYLMDEIDSLIDTYNIEVFCMADIWNHCNVLQKKVYWHVLEDIKPQKKFDKLTICHSPSRKATVNKKGTKEIAQVIKRIQKERDVDFICITDKTRGETIELRAKCHIFIDQLSTGGHLKEYGYKGGLGKSGLEGMKSECLTITSSERVATNISTPPFVMANNESDLYFKLKMYIDNEDVLKKTMKRQKQWVDKYTSFLFVKKYILDE